MFKKPTNPLAEESQRLIEAGGLPPAATARLQENAGRQGTPAHLFTSNFSVNELLLTHDCGYEPLGQVMGTSVYHVGWQFYPGQTSGPVNPISGLPLSAELTLLTQAYHEARTLAFGRLRQEAEILRADGVVGVRFERIGVNLPAGTFEFKAVGTAVRKTGAPPNQQGSPFLSNLSGQDHWALRQAGMKPVGFAFGNCSWYQVSGWRNQSLSMSAGWGSMGNKEFPDFTQGVYNARELAMERLEEDARFLKAAGVVGVTIDPQIQVVDIEQGGQGRRDLIVQFTVYGTAIDYEPGPEPKVQVQQTVPLTN